MNQYDQSIFFNSLLVQSGVASLQCQASIPHLHDGLARGSVVKCSGPPRTRTGPRAANGNGPPSKFHFDIIATSNRTKQLQFLTGPGAVALATPALGGTESASLQPMSLVVFYDTR